MVTTADPEHLSHLNHFIRYLIVPFQIKRSNCVYKSPLGFQALFLGHIFLKSNTHPHTDTHSHITGSSRSRRGLFLITFNASPNKQMVDWFCWARLYCSGWFSTFLSQSSTYCIHVRLCVIQNVYLEAECCYCCSFVYFKHSLCWV